VLEAFVIAGVPTFSPHEIVEDRTVETVCLTNTNHEWLTFSFSVLSTSARATLNVLQKVVMIEQQRP
jgi:hypothetical protein